VLSATSESRSPPGASKIFITLISRHAQSKNITTRLVVLPLFQPVIRLHFETVPPPPPLLTALGGVGSRLWPRLESTTTGAWEEEEEEADEEEREENTNQ